jgi:acetyltransferase
VWSTNPKDLVILKRKNLMVKEIFEAKSFAVVGASREENKVGHIIFKNLISRGIKVFPINPNAESILGQVCFKSLLKIEKIDCVIIAVPAKIVPSILRDMAKKRIKNAVVISSGFSEAGNEKLSEKIKKISKKNKINLIGPNTMGFINPYNNINTSFFDGMPEKGKIAFLSQSGAIGAAVLDRNIKLSGFVSLGNSLMIDFSHFIEYFSNDKNTEIIALYIESIGKGKGRRFIEACKKCKKPIIALKAGKTKIGSKAANSHTAALASEEGIYEGNFKQCRIIEVNSIKELFSVAELCIKIKRLGNKACIVTNAGGPGVLCSDYCIKNGIELPELPSEIFCELDKILPPGWSKNNPIDILGDAKAELYFQTINILRKENFFDFFIILLTPQYMTEPYKTSEVILNIKDKPVITSFLGEDKVKLGINHLHDKVMVFEELKEMCEALGKVIGKN